MDNMTPEQLMIPVDEQLPEFGVPVIGYNREWVDEDFNHRGLRECFIYGDGTQWHTAKWVDGPDCYETTDDDKPTHWAPMLNSAALSANGGEAIYQIKLPVDVSSAWHDASEDAYHVISEGWGRIVYTHPATPPAHVSTCHRILDDLQPYTRSIHKRLPD